MFMGLGPAGFGKEVSPFPLATQIFLFITFTLVGYHPVGIKPLEEDFPGVETLKTARQLLSALATYNVFSSLLSASPLLVLPGNASG